MVERDSRKVVYTPSMPLAARRWVFGAIFGLVVAGPLGWIAWDRFYAPSVEMMFQDGMPFLPLPKWLVKGSAASIPIQFAIAAAIVGGWIQYRWSGDR